MNRSYRSLWNDSTGTFVAVSENASSAGKKTSSGVRTAGIGTRFTLQALAVSVMLAFGGNALAQPSGGVVAAGAASISTGAGSTTIHQSSQNAIINWQSFNIAAGQSVQFVQPGSSSVALNRVLGADPSSILGSLTANGKVFLVNPNGILFGKGASVNVGGLVASTLNITDADFMAGNYKFSGGSQGAVLNQGTINADGGYVALLGANVSNDGVISAQLGTVALAAGNAMTLDVAGDGLLNVRVDQGAVNALVQNGGLIQADGGQVLLTARSASSLLPSAVNNTGVVRAQTLVTGENGSIKLMGDMQSGTVNVGGTLDASGVIIGQTGGKVTVTGHHVGLFGGQINATGDAGGGTVLIGGDYQGNNSSVQNAAATYMSADASINADAVTTGNGGKVVLWADDSTRVKGSISTRGGAQSGNGGLIETSGHALDVAGIRIDASAANGMAGNWLLDPADVTIGAGTVGATQSAGVYSPDSGLNAASVDAAALVGVLNGGTDVTITTTNNGTPGTGVGDITVAAALTWTTGKALTLNAAHDVIVNAGSAITASTAGSGIVLNAGNDVKVNAALVADALGSKIALTAGNDVLVTAAVTASAQDTVLSMSAGRDVAVTAALTASGTNAKINLTAGGNASVFTTTADGGGAVNVIANKDVTVNGKISASGGTVTLRADSDGTGPGALAGTVRFTGDNTVSSVSAVNTVVRFNPAGYANTTTEIAAYVAKIVAGGADVKAWVFAQGVDKQYDGDNTATLQFRNPLGDNPNIGNTVTLNGGTATFNTKDVGVLKPVTFNGYTVGGPDLAKFDLYSALGVASGNGTTTANITPAPLTVKANDASKVYGETPALSTTAFTTPTPPVAGETVGSVTMASVGTAANASVAGGAYNIIPSSATGGTFNPANYTITYQNGLLTVTPAPLTVRANDATKVYGQTFTPLGTAFTTPVAPRNGETVGSITAVSPDGAPATASVAGSPYAIIPSNATGGTFDPANYTITYQNGFLTVTPTPLVLTANDATKVYGTTFTPADTAFTKVGLVNNDTVTRVAETSSGSVPTAGVVGSPYPIVISPGSATGSFTPSNYTITYVNGKLIVTPAPLVLTANDATKVYGTTFTPAGTAFTQVGLLNSDTVTRVAETSSGSPPPASVAGSPYPIVITPGSETGSFTATNYIIRYVDGKLTVTPAPLTITATNVTKNYGETPVLSGFTTTPLVNGETVGSVTETSPGQPATAPGGTTYPITPTSVTGGTFTPTNYTIDYVNGVLTVIPAPVVVPPVVVPPVVVPPDVEAPPVVVPPVVVPPDVEVPPVVVPPVVVPPDVEVPPVVVPPVVVPPDVITPPDVVAPPDVAAPPELPYESPNVKPPVNVPTWVPVVLPPVLPPQLVTLVPPVPPPVVVVPVPVVEQPPVIVPPVAPPQIYVAPPRPRKQDRN